MTRPKTHMFFLHGWEGEVRHGTNEDETAEVGPLRIGFECRQSGLAPFVSGSSWLYDVLYDVI